MPDPLLNRGQVKMFETLAVLVVFFFFLIFGASFYFKLQENSLMRELDKTGQLRAIQVSQKSLHLPELDCSFVNVQRDNCFDILKAQKFGALVTADENALIEYFKTFEYSTLTVYGVYPVPSTIVLYDRQRDGSVTVLQIPLLLYDARQGDYGFGYLEVKAYG
ncbi:hypothetical protein HY492_04120 [Candidatus Woesearchaeota archaeon]|nr:hypothetical protein [Candidatus Woesearchaeota archaeon]